ncbi:winged helix-turn-helix domain-containing protein [Thermoplasma volcanium]|nr:winged helix-turn-helix domain-containing protein [Thermoplasma volcanium]
MCSPLENTLREIVNASVVSNYPPSTCVSVVCSQNGDKEKMLAKSLSIYFVSKIIYHKPDGSSEVIKNEEENINLRFSQSVVTGRKQKAKIIFDILSFIKTPECTGIKSIIYNCNLNYRTAIKIQREMESRGPKEKQQEGRNGKYILTSKGTDFLEAIQFITL